MGKLTNAVVAGACLVAAAFPCTAQQSSTLYSVPHYTLNPGATRLSGGSTYYAHAASIGAVVATGTFSSPCFQVRSGYLRQSKSPPQPITLVSVVSRKAHAATNYNLPIDHLLVASCAITVEPRGIGSGHTLVFHFDGAVVSTGAVTAMDSLMNPISVSSTLIVGNDVLVTLANVPNTRRVTVMLPSVNGADPLSVSLGFLVGDVNNSRAVTAADISAIKANVGPVLNGSNYRFDLSTDGKIDFTDITAAKSRGGQVLQ